MVGGSAVAEALLGREGVTLAVSSVHRILLRYKMVIEQDSHGQETGPKPAQSDPQPVGRHNRRKLVDGASGRVVTAVPGSGLGQSDRAT